MNCGSVIATTSPRLLSERAPAPGATSRYRSICRPSGAGKPGASCKQKSSRCGSKMAPLRGSGNPGVVDQLEFRFLPGPQGPRFGSTELDGRLSLPVRVGDLRTAEPDLPVARTDVVCRPDRRTRIELQVFRRSTWGTDNGRLGPQDQVAAAVLHVGIEVGARTQPACPVTNAEPPCTSVPVAGSVGSAGRPEV